MFCYLLSLYNEILSIEGAVACLADQAAFDDAVVGAVKT